MITLTISRTDLTTPALPLTINDSGAGTYVLASFEPGARVKQNSIAESRWLDGGALVSTKTGILTMDLVIQIRAASYAALMTAAATLDDAFDQFGYTITRTDSGALNTTPYTCLPANTNFAHDPILFRAGMGLYSASIPRQP